MDTVRFQFNEHFKKNTTYTESFKDNDNDVTEFHKSLPGYEPTPLVNLPNLAKKLGVKQILIKDESKRFNLNAFKGLGASYAIFKFLQKNTKKRVEEN